MSTRSVLAKAQHDGWEGIYCHSDGYPTWRGPEIWQHVHDKYAGNVSQFITEMIDGHPGGWSSFGDRCYCHDMERDDHEMVYTHADEAENAALHIEWLYICHPNILTIYAGMQTGETYTAQGYHGPYEEPFYRWKLVAQVLWTDAEPDWKAIEKQREAFVA